MAAISDIDRMVPWSPLVVLIAPVYVTGEDTARPPVGLERM